MSTCLYVCITICVSPFVCYLHLHSKMLTDWTVSKSDAGLNDSKLLFFACSNTITSRFHYFSLVFVHVSACVCVHPVLNVMKGIFCSSQSQFITRVKHTHTHTQWPSWRCTYSYPGDSVCTQGSYLHDSNGSTQLTTHAFTLWCKYVCMSTHSKLCTNTHTCTRTIPWLPVVHPSKSFLLSSACQEHSECPANQWDDFSGIMTGQFERIKWTRPLVFYEYCILNEQPSR